MNDGHLFNDWESTQCADAIGADRRVNSHYMYQSSEREPWSFFSRLMSIDGDVRRWEIFIVEKEVKFHSADDICLKKFYRLARIQRI